MKIVEKTVYVADDGKEFTSSDECHLYEFKLTLIKTLNDHPDLFWGDISPSDVAEVLLKNYVLVPK